MDNSKHIESKIMKPSKQPRRPHYIKEWAEQSGYIGPGKYTRLAADLGVNKSLITNWYKGGSPGEVSQSKLSELFNCSTAALFRHPDDEWLSRFISKRDPVEVNKIKTMLKSMYEEANS